MMTGWEGTPGERCNAPRKEGSPPLVCTWPPRQRPGQSCHSAHLAEGLEARAGPGSEPAARPALPHQAALLQRENLQPAERTLTPRV